MEEARNLRRTITGVVSSSKMEKSITVTVTRKIKHEKYGKFLTKSKRYHAHDEKNDAKAGDIVKIMETRPLSKLKRWRLLEIVERAK
ncbi:MAG: 30S ribosomal protein S17 [Bacteroidetes bacterium]|nr:30S ribosomal protein S17 [Bacteroidota bacterium]MBP7398831.1 30S ribosomal protein S17 [Chitinophagales bacterium]MBK7107833.1 30S ribosomal protein S17 [Bacteroidota bacterium]MBK8486730.1 30S ribosomal protein S17 [Bacteroidota bacterium]MBK8681366.1 30S ribosomal protein S17 [Bacteroidota bacterium]